MNIKVINIEAYPNQELSFIENGDRYRLTLNTRKGLLYASLSSESVGDIIHNRLCLNRVPITKNLIFIDINGNENPVYSGLNSRFFLLWINNEQEEN